MSLNAHQVGYFIQQVGKAAASFGISDEDVMIIGAALSEKFDYRCSPQSTVVYSQGPQLQAICQDDTCPLSPNASCSAYGTPVEPVVANATLAMGEGTNSTSNSTKSSPTPPSNKAPSKPAGKSTGSVIQISLALMGVTVLAVAL